MRRRRAGGAACQAALKDSLTGYNTSIRTFALVAALFLFAAAPAAAEELTGTVVLEHADRFEDGVADESALLKTKDDGTLELRGNGRRWRELAGRRIRVRGRKRGNAVEEPVLLAAGARDTAATGGPTAAPIDDTDPAPRKLAVVLVSSPGDVARRWDPLETERVMFSDQRSVASYFRTLSFGRIDFAGDVFGFYDIEGDGAACDHVTIARQAEAAAAADGKDLTQYDHIMYVTPRDDACPWGGLGNMPGRHTWVSARPSDIRIPAHELGHNLGVHHAGSLGCDDAGRPSSLTGTCTTVEYGDPYSVMGFSRTGLLSNWHRTQLGLVPGAQRRDATRDGLYELTTINDDQGGTKLLRIPRSGGEEWLALEVRTPLAPFTLEPEPSGVFLRATPSIERRGVSGLVDAAPGSPAGYGDAPLQPGQTFEDAATRSVIRIESIAGGVARVRVGFLPEAPRPAVAADPGAARLFWPRAGDDTAVVRYEIERDGAIVAETASTSFRDEPPAGVRSYRVHAVDGAGNRTPSAPVSVDVPPAPPRPEPAPPEPQTPDARPGTQRPELSPPVPSLSPDRTRPTLTLTARRVGRDRRLPVRVADDRRGVRVAIRLDGRPVGGSIRTRLPSRALRGRHRVEVVATDRAGNARTLRLVLRNGRVAFK